MIQNFEIRNMTCAACVATVTRAVEQLKGVKKAEVRLISGDMTVEYDEERLDEGQIIKAVERAGYGIVLQETDRSRRERERREAINNNLKSLRQRFFVSAILLVPLLYVSMGEMIGIPLLWWLVHGSYGNIIVQSVLTLAICIINYKYFTNGFKLLFRLHPNMDSLVALGCTASVVYSVFMLFHDMHEMLYFESAATILTLVTLGKFLEARSKRSTNTAVTRLLDLSPKTVTVKRGAK